MIELVGIQPVLDMITLALQSSFVANEKNGVSVIFIGKPETAKTSCIFKFNDLDFVSYYDEITQKKLIDEFLPLVKVGQKKTLLVPDLINCIEKQRMTREQFLNIIKSGIDDVGVMQISTQYKQLSYMKLTEGLKFNFITAITTPNFQKIKKSIINSGLLSRFVPFSYEYPISKLKTIFDLIEGFEVSSDVEVRQIKKESISVYGNPNLFKEFEIISTNIGREYKGYGLRIQKSLQRLAKANALLEGRDYVDRADIDKIVSLSEWINFDFNPI